jgi:hypothetical protein
MKKQWHHYLFTVTPSLRGTNLLSISGAFVSIISLPLPWFEKVYSQTESYVSGASVLLGYFSGEKSAPLLLVVSILCLCVVPVFAFFRLKKGLCSLAALASLILLSLAVFLVPAPFASVRFGVWCGFAGLLLMTTSYFGTYVENAGE